MDRSISETALRALADHRHEMHECPDHVWRCLFCMFEMRIISNGSLNRPNPYASRMRVPGA